MLVRAPDTLRSRNPLVQQQQQQQHELRFSDLGCGLGRHWQTVQAVIFPEERMEYTKWPVKIGLSSGQAMDMQDELSGYCRDAGPVHSLN